MRALAVLRPEPGNAATCARIAAAGATALSLPLFELRSLAWEPPPATGFDALFLTSANAVRHAGPALSSYRDLPTFAVGVATASAARSAGLAITAVGDGDGQVLARLAAKHGARRALHLAGRDRAQWDLLGVSRTIAVYASEAIDPSPAQLVALEATVALVHSPRAGARLADLVADPAQIRPTRIRVAAISAAALQAAGDSWNATIVAARPDDESLIAAALSLAD